MQHLVQDYKSLICRTTLTTTNKTHDLSRGCQQSLLEDFSASLRVDYKKKVWWWINTQNFVECQANNFELPLCVRVHLSSHVPAVNFCT